MIYDFSALLNIKKIILGATLIGSTAFMAPAIACTAPEGYAKIFNELDLQSVRGNLSGRFFLCNDLTVSAGFYPIGMNAVGPNGAAFPAGPFQGVFNGGGRTIYGININRDESSIGLFSLIGESGIVRQLKIRQPIVRGSYSVGALAGFSLGRVEDVIVEYPDVGFNDHRPGLPLDYNRGFAIGGIVGRFAGSAAIVNSRVVGGRVTGVDSVGGIVGSAEGDQGSIQGVSSYPTVMGVDSQIGIASRSIGGVVGGAYGTNSNSSAPLVKSSKFFGIASGRTKVGGIVGSLTGRSVTECASFARVGGESSVGGVVGFMQLAQLTNSYFSALTVKALGNSPKYIGGVVGWNIDGGVSYVHNNGFVELPAGLDPVANNTIGGVTGENTSSYRQAFTQGFYNVTRNPGLSAVTGYKGTRLTSGQMTDIAFYRGSFWNISPTTDPAITIWKIAVGGGAPFLK